VLDTHGCGLCVDPRNPAALASAILAIADNPVLRAQMAENGVNAVEAHYSWESQEKRMLEVYNKLLSG